MEEKVKEALQLIDSQIESLGEIVSHARADSDFDAGYERLKRWKARTARLLEENIHPHEASALEAKEKGSFLMGEPFINLSEEADLYRGFLQTPREALPEHPEEVLAPPKAVAAEDAKPAAVPAVRGSTVFIIHGHDELNLLRLKGLLRERFGLDAPVLSGRPGRGRTLIEKFEQEAQAAAFAIAVLTPDDLVVGGGEEYGQPRPNVVLELGWFYGRLGRERVCILFKEGIRIHADLDGISRIGLRESVEDKSEEIANELTAAGLIRK